ncbi:MAG TPA: M23 family metallopeptidase [bacterium]|nr:M23 family metallopeptidase [bacterium]HPL95510.1 M23 family metallopeptidase [bacterium]
MAYLLTKKLIFPLENYKVNSYKFKEKCWYGTKYWGIHLGEDVNIKSGTKVLACGRGRVVYSALHTGDREKSNWGNIIIIAHKNIYTRKNFFSLYAHLKRRLANRGDKIEVGQTIGFVGKKNSPENGWWKDEHLHFAIYTGLWTGKVLPGYWKKNLKRAKLSDWQKPSYFIKHYERFL